MTIGLGCCFEAIWFFGGLAAVAGYSLSKAFRAGSRACGMSVGARSGLRTGC